MMRVVKVDTLRLFMGYRKEPFIKIGCVGVEFDVRLVASYGNVLVHVVNEFSFIQCHHGNTVEVNWCRCVDK